MITDYDIVEFTCGGCLVLAEVIADATGWQLCAFDEMWGGPDIHVFVRTPDGYYLDVRGKQTQEEMFSGFPLAASVSEYEPEDFGSGWDRDPRYYRRAGEIAAELIEAGLGIKEVESVLLKVRKRS